MDEFELRTQDIAHGAEGAERLALQSLDDATYEPRAYLEQTGDSAQAEAIQNDLTAVVETVIGNINTGGGVGGGDDETRAKIPESQTPSGIDTGAVIDETLHLKGEIYYSHETGTGPVPHKYGSEESEEEEDDGSIHRYPGVEPIGEDEGWIDDGGTGGSAPVVTMGGEFTYVTPEGGLTPIPEGNETGPREGKIDEGSLGHRAEKKNLAGIEEQDTVSGRQPKIVEGVLDGAPSGGNDDDRENITPINLPGPVGDQSRPHSGIIEDAPGRGTPGKHFPEPGGPNSDRRAIAGIEERDTVSGQQPKIGEGVLDGAPSAGDDDDRENITPINLPGPLGDQSRPHSGVIENAPNAGTPGKIDPVTGEIIGPTGGVRIESEDEQEVPGKPSMTLQDSGEGQAVRRDFKGVPQEAPQVEQYQVSQPKGRVDAGRAPLGPRPEKPPEVPPKVDQTEGKQRPGSDDLIGQQELNINPHFADQALGAIGMGPHGMLGNGEVKGMQGKVWGYGPGAPGRGVPGGPKMGGTDSQDLGQGSHGSSSGGPPVHGYGPGAKGAESAKTTKEWTDKDGKKHSSSGTSSGPGSCTQSGSSADSWGTDQSKAGSTGTATVKCSSGQIIVVRFDPNGSASTVWNTIDGGNPMPYTGNWSGGKSEPRDPGIFGGTQEIKGSGHFAPVVSHDGKGGGGGGGGDPSIYDDGNWYGGLFGGGGLPGFFPGDPDGLDYYTPDEPANIAKK